VCTQAAQGLQIFPQGIKAGFIETEDVTGKGGERCGYRLGTALGQVYIDYPPQLLKRLQTALQEPFDQAIAREPNGGKRAKLL
jgi:hypothetical protein